MKTYIALAVGVTAGLIAAPITIAANAEGSSNDAGVCAQIIDEYGHADRAHWRNAERHDGRATVAATNRWRVDTLYLQSWSRVAGC